MATTVPNFASLYKNMQSKVEGLIFLSTLKEENLFQRPQMDFSKGSKPVTGKSNGVTMIDLVQLWFIP